MAQVFQKAKSCFEAVKMSDVVSEEGQLEAIPAEQTEIQSDFLDETEFLEENSDLYEGPAKNENFGESLELLTLSHSDAAALRHSWDVLANVLGDRESVGDAIYGALTSALASLKDAFRDPRAVMSVRMFNGFGMMVDKRQQPEELKLLVETLAFKHLGQEVSEVRVGLIADAFVELMMQNLPEPPPGCGSAWRQLLMYVGSAFRFVSATFGQRLKTIEDDWKAIQAAAEGETEEAVVRSFPKMCAFSNEVMGQTTEVWMEELLAVFGALVERIGNPAHLQEECDLLAISMVSKSKDIQFDRFKPVMLAALRSLLPKSWSTTHETAWEWLWATIARNLSESAMKVRAYKPYSSMLYSKLTDEQMEHFRSSIYPEFFAKSTASQDLFKQSQTRLRYIADRVLQSAYDMFHKTTSEMVDELSALGLRHVGYGVPIELFGPFTDTCVQVMKPLIQQVPHGASGHKQLWCPADRSHMVLESEVPLHLMTEGFRWSIGLVARILVRTITEGSTAVMQAIHRDDAKQLRKALRDAPRASRVVWQLRVRVGSQSISPLFWALRSGAFSAAKTMIQDVLTIRADRDRYYYGADELFRLQPDVAANVLREAPLLAETLLDGLIWRSNKTQEGQRPVIYYLEHLLQDTDESQMLARSMVSFVNFKDPKTITHPILVFATDLLWEKLVMRFFLLDRLWTVATFVIFILSQCYLNQPALINDPTWAMVLVCARLLVYFMGFGRLLFWHAKEIYRALAQQEMGRSCGVRVPQYLTQCSQKLSLVLMFTLMLMLMVEPMIHCVGSTEEQVFKFECEAWTDGMSLMYEILSIAGIFMFCSLVLDVTSISITMSEYTVLCTHALKQVTLCFMALFTVVCTFTFAIASMSREAQHVSGEEWKGFSATGSLIQVAFGLMDLESMAVVAQESPLLFIVILLFTMIVYSFFFNLLVSQFCGVYMSLASDIQGHARLGRGQIILETLKTVRMARWKRFMSSLALDRRVDFGEGDIGLAGGIKAWEPALLHAVSKDEIIRFGGQTDPSLPWPEKDAGDANEMERMIRGTIQRTLKSLLGKKGINKSGGDDTTSSHHSSSHRSSLDE